MLKRSIQLVGLLLIGLLVVQILNYSFDLIVSPGRRNIQIARCPQGSDQRLRNYSGSIAHFLDEENVAYRDFGDNHAKIALMFKELEGKHESLVYPGCAEFLFQTYSRYLHFEIRAYEELAKGGLISQILFDYYHMRAGQERYLMPFIMSIILPPPPLRDDGQLHA
ncbi:MAG: hypothetical protein WBD86_02295 [Microgenomates group bacterium]